MKLMGISFQLIVKRNIMLCIAAKSFVSDSFVHFVNKTNKYLELKKLENSKSNGGIMLSIKSENAKILTLVIWHFRQII